MYDYEKSQRLLPAVYKPSTTTGSNISSSAKVVSELRAPVTSVVDNHSRQQHWSSSSNNSSTSHKNCGSNTHLRRSTSMHVQRLTDSLHKDAEFLEHHHHHWANNQAVYSGAPINQQHLLYRHYSDDDTALGYQDYQYSALYPHTVKRQQVFNLVPSYLQEYYPEVDQVVDTRGRSLVKQGRSCQDFGENTHSNGEEELYRKGTPIRQDNKPVSSRQGKKYLIRSSSGPAGSQGGLYNVEYIPSDLQQVIMSSSVHPRDSSPSLPDHETFVHGSYSTDLDYKQDVGALQGRSLHGYTAIRPAENHQGCYYDEACKEPIYENVNPKHQADGGTVVDPVNPKTRFWTYSGRPRPQGNLTRHASILDMQWNNSTHISEMEELDPSGQYIHQAVDPVWYEKPYALKTHCVTSDKVPAGSGQPRDSSPRISYKEREVSPTPRKKEVKLTREKSFLFPWERRKVDNENSKKEKDHSPQMSPRNKKRLVLPWERSESKKVSGDSSPEVLNEDVKPHKKETKAKKSLKLKKVTKRSESEKYADKSKHPATVGLVRRQKEETVSHKRSHSDESSHKVVRNKESSSSPATPKSKTKQSKQRPQEKTGGGQGHPEHVSRGAEFVQKPHVPVYKSRSGDSVMDGSQNWCYLYWSDGEGLK